MNPPTEISPSTQLLLDEIHKLFNEFNRELDESEARWERRDSESQAARAQRVAAVESHVDIPKRIPAAQLDDVVVADNWGGLFEQPADFLEVRDLDLSDAPAVAHNWGGLFDGGNYFSTCSSSASVTPAPSAATSVVQSTTEFAQAIQKDAGHAAGGQALQGPLRAR